MEENPIIQHLRAFPASEVYYIAPKQYFIRGYEYYRLGRLLSIEWNKDKTTLTARVRGSQIYEVTFFGEDFGEDFAKDFAKDELLPVECDCPAWLPDTQCKHVVCVVLALKNILDPRLFDIGRQRDEYQSRFHRILLPAEGAVPDSAPDQRGAGPARKEGPEYSIVLHQKKNASLEVEVLEDGRALPQYGYLRVPAPLRTLAEADRFYYLDRYQSFYDYLRKHGNLYPVFLKTGGEKIPLGWDPSLDFSARTGIDLQNDRVNITRFSVCGGEICRNAFPLGEKLIADLERQRIGVMKDKRGWALWQSYAEMLTPGGWGPRNSMNDPTLDEVLSIPFDQFRDLQLTLPDAGKDTLKECLFSVGQQILSPVKAKHTYSMVIEQDRGQKDFLVLKACCHLGELREATTRVFFDFIPYFLHGDFYSIPLGAQKRRAVLFKTFMKILSIKGKQEAEETIRKSLNEDGDFYKRDHRSEARRLLMHAFSSINSRPVRLHCYDDRWYQVGADKEREALLYTIPYEIFGPEVFTEMKGHNEMTVPAKTLYQHLPPLYFRLKDHQIPLFFKGKAFKEAKWDISLDCRRESGIDWFEIKPEIRCNGRRIDEALLRQAMAGNGMVEGDDLIEILDPNSQEVLKAIASLTKREKGTKGDAKEIVRVPRLQILDWIYLRNKGVEVRLSKEDEALIERLSRFEKIEKRPVPKGLRAELRPYQKEGYYWLSFLYEHRFGACLADDMGLGKTLQAITLLAGIREGLVNPPGRVEGPHLLVLPTSLVFNWEREIGRFYPYLKMYVYTGKERSTEFDKADVVLTTYGLLRRDIDKLKKISFNVIIFDEAQAVKNILAATTGAARELKGQFKLAMTGTPIENHLGEYYSILDLSLPGLLGDYDDFKSYIKLETSPFMDILLRRTRPFVLRRTKEKILKQKKLALYRAVMEGATGGRKGAPVTRADFDYLLSDISSGAG